MVQPAICIADRPSKIKKYEDNRAVCATKRKTDLEPYDNSY